MENELFLGGFKGWSYNEIVNYIVENFEVEKSIVDNYHIIIANSDLGDYEESAFFLLTGKTDGKLYIVDGSHCSCYGFEGQFETDETEIEYLISDNAYFGSSLSDTEKNKIQKRFILMIRYLKLEQIKNRIG